MKSLTQYNSDRRMAIRQERASGNVPQRNGIACPSCRSELFDTSPMVTLTSDPPQKHVHCQCGFSGLRVA